MPFNTDGLKVLIEKSCWKDMFGWCRAATTEVSGFGLVSLKDREFRVSRVFFPEQEDSSGFTHIGHVAQGRLDYSLYKRKLPMEQRRFWWHTHYNFSAFWSGIDDDQAMGLAKNNGEWSLSLVINQAGDWLCRTDFVNPFTSTVDKLPVFLVPDSYKHGKRNYKSDIKRWVNPYRGRSSEIDEQEDTKEYITVKHIDDNFINYGGRVLKKELFLKLINCPCDGSCIDCREIVNV